MDRQKLFIKIEEKKEIKIQRFHIQFNSNFYLHKNWDSTFDTVPIFISVFICESYTSSIYSCICFIDKLYKGYI